MIRIHFFCCLCAAALVSFASCGTAISDAKNFSRNAAPAISSFRAVNADGSAIDQSKIAVKCVYLLTVVAADPDNQKLSYAFRSPCGTFKNQTETTTGCTVQFVAGVVTGGANVAVSVDVRDSRGAVTGRTLDIGTGKFGPSISAVSDRAAIRPNGDFTLSVSSNSAGNFQIVPLGANEVAGSPPSWDSSKYVMTYKAGAASAAAVLTGPLSSTSGSAELAKTADGKYPDATFYGVWVLFKDSLGQIDAVLVKAGVDGTAPQVVATDPADNQPNVASERYMYVTFGEDVAVDSFTDESLSLSQSGCSVSFVKEKSSRRMVCFLVSGLSKDTVYTASVMSGTDLVGNSVDPAAAQSSFSFTTTLTYAVTYDANCGDASGSAPVDANRYDMDGRVTVQGRGTLSRVDYNFAGWNTAGDGTGVSYTPGDPSAGSFVVPGDVTLYAQWTLKPYQVNYNLNGGEGSITDSRHYNAGETVTVSGTVPVRDGYTFKGWSDTLGGAAIGDNLFVISSNKTLYAVWAQVRVASITLNRSGVIASVGFSPVQLTATVAPADASIQTVTWSSNNTGVATVSDAGLVTIAGGIDTATITASCDGKTAGCAVRVYAKLNVNTKEELDAIRNNLGGHYVLGTDIDLTGVVWTPIGTSLANGFKGKLEGNGKTIRGLTITGDSSDRGLFGYTGSSAEITGLKLTNVSIAGHSYVGGLVGHNYGTVTSCLTSGSVVGVSDSGGLCGSNQGSISCCYSECTVTVSTQYGGGLVGTNWSGTIENCYATGAVHGGTYVGGLVGQQCRSIINCYAIGTVTGSGTDFGGLIGCRANSFSTTNSYFTGNDNLMGGTRLAESAMKAIPATWLTSIWAINSGINGGYPYLQQVGFP